MKISKAHGAFVIIFFIFATLFNICHANNNLTKNKPCFDATLLTAVLNSHRSEANIFMKLIPLTQGKFAMVDDEDYEFLIQWKWYAQKGYNTMYAVRGIYNGKNMSKERMHRVIVGVTNQDQYPDHIDRNGLNNQRSNLRISNKSENNSNRCSLSGSTSKYLGVYICISSKSVIKKNGELRVYRYTYWRAGITKNGVFKFLGNFKNEIDAAKAYDEGAKIYHGEFANLNFK
jgi:hypothetical protein